MTGTKRSPATWGHPVPAGFWVGNALAFTLIFVSLMWLLIKWITPVFCLVILLSTPYAGFGRSGSVMEPGNLSYVISGNWQKGFNIIGLAVVETIDNNRKQGAAGEQTKDRMSGVFKRRDPSGRAPVPRKYQAHRKDGREAL